MVVMIFVRQAFAALKMVKDIWVCRGAFPGRPTLKNNKYVRPTTEIANGATPSATA